MIVRLRQAHPLAIAGGGQSAPAARSAPGTREMPPDLHDRHRAGFCDQISISFVGSGPGMTVSTSLRAASGRPSAAADAMIEETPGTISVG
jgi:hypothetical protein